MTSAATQGVQTLTVEGVGAMLFFKHIQVQRLVLYLHRKHIKFDMNEIVLTSFICKIPLLARCTRPKG